MVGNICKQLREDVELMSAEHGNKRPFLIGYSTRDRPNIKNNVWAHLKTVTTKLVVADQTLKDLQLHRTHDFRITTFNMLIENTSMRLEHVKHYLGWKFLGTEANYDRGLIDDVLKQVRNMIRKEFNLARFKKPTELTP